ncbi:MAG: AtpZ/AtpI family protein [Lachnospiraceae bacterium]|nr:AtpZ/AtpI family protein [Lachnospiraceae bacterium]
MTKVLRKIAFLTQFGLTMLIPTCLLFFLGYYLDRKFQTSFWSVILFFVGALAGATGVWRLIKKELSNDRPDLRNRDLAPKNTESNDKADEGEITPDAN